MIQVHFGEENCNMIHMKRINQELTELIVYKHWIERFEMLDEIRKSGLLMGITEKSSDVEVYMRLKEEDWIMQHSQKDSFRYISEITFMEMADFSNCEVPPHVFEKLRHISSLGLTAVTNTSAIVKSISESNSSDTLRRLTVTGTSLDNLSGISRLSGLRDILMITVNMQTFPIDLCWVPNLTKLTIACGNISYLPDEFANLRNLRKLSLIHNSFESIPHCIVKLDNLMELDLDDNRITEISKEMRNMKSLVCLNLSRNDFGSFPMEVCDIPNLEVLLLNSNTLFDVPPEIGLMTKLIGLQMSYTRIHDIPNEISNLQNLTALDLSDNHLTKLPETFSSLKLEFLEISGNKFKELPLDMIDTTLLSEFNCRDNPSTSENRFLEIKIETTIKINRLKKHTKDFLNSSVEKIYNLVNLVWK